jgi:hypothetical protein
MWIRERKDVRLTERLEIRTTEEMLREFNIIKAKYGFARNHDLLKWLLLNFKEPIFEEAEIKFI